MTKLEQLQQQCTDWNERNPIGTFVIYTADLGEEIITRTRSRAQVLSNHTSVIWLDNKRGCVALDRIKVRRH